MSKPIAHPRPSNFLSAGQRPSTAPRQRPVSEVSKRYHQLVALKKRHGGPTTGFSS